VDLGHGLEDRISAEVAYRLLGFQSQQRFNHARQRLERVFDRDTGMHTPVPDFKKLFARLSEGDARRRRREFLDSRILVVPEWGGIKWPGCSWTYSRERCQRTCDEASPITGPAAN
jgi:hypothetical protein